MRFDGKKPIEFTDETVALEEENLEEDTKYKLKLDAPKSEPAFGGSGGEESLDAFDDAPADGGGGFGDAGGFGDEEGGDEPFDATPFDAGVEASEEEDPEKYIQQLAGKIGTSMRKYNDERGEPDFDLEKYAINSVISASHTSEMDEEDQDDIIRKVKTSGAADDSSDADKEVSAEPEVEPEVDAEPTSDTEDMFGGDEGGLEENEMLGYNEALYEEEPLDKYLRQMMDKNPMVDSFYLMFSKSIKGKEWNRLIVSTRPMARSAEFEAKDSEYSKLFVSDEQAAKVKDNWGSYMGKHISDPVFDEFREGSDLNYTELSEEDTMTINLRNMKQDAEDILAMDKVSREEKLKGHKWADDHISTSADDAEEVADFLTTESNPCWDGYERVPGTKEGEKGSCKKKTSESLNEAEYKGDKVTLNKPTKGDVKKFKVYVKNDKGNVVKVNFGDKNMEIRRDNPEAKKSFRARHKCSEKKDKTTAGYWSCKMWSNKKVSDIVGEDLQESKKNDIFAENKDMKTIIKGKLDEMVEPAIKPPVVKPGEKPTKPRRKRIFQPNPGVKTPAKMKGDGSDTE